jgi:hypothetical protein
MNPLLRPLRQMFEGIAITVINVAMAEIPRPRADAKMWKIEFKDGYLERSST